MIYPDSPEAMRKFDELTRSMAFKALNPARKLKAMLEFKSFDTLIEHGDLLNAQMFAARTGYTPQHVRRLCREGKISCIKRGYQGKSPQADEEFQYFFLPEHVTAFFAAQNARA